MDEKLAVYFERGLKYNAEQLIPVIAKFLEESGISDKIKGKRVLIKPNMLAPFEPSRGVTTHPSVIEAVAANLKKLNCFVGIGDSPGDFISGQNLNKLYRKTGVLNIIQKYGLQAEDLSAVAKAEVPSASRFKYYELAARISDYDFLINLPKIKTHMFQLMTCGVKNLFGLIPGRRKAEFHLKLPNPPDFADMLLDIALIAKPVFTIVDGIDAMEGEGPAAGTTKELGLMLASNDVFLLDAVIALITDLGIDVPTVKKGKERNLFDIDLARNIASEIGKFPLQKPTQKTLDQRLPSWFKDILKGLISNKPYVEPARCIGCGICARNCPPQAITMQNNLPKINYSECIRCFCCHELCPENAMQIKYGLLNRIIG